MRENDLLTRIFLRDCAFIERLHGRGASEWVWHFAALSVSIRLSTGVLLAFFVLAALLRGRVPTDINPLTAEPRVMLMQLAAVVLLVGFWVDSRFARYKQDLTEANGYSTAADLWKWWLASLLTFVFTLAIGAVVVLSGEGYLRW